jgi:hypothetical protein
LASETGRRQEKQEEVLTMSNLLAMPLVTLALVTGNKEDWIDSVKFLIETGEPVLPQLDLRNIIFEMEVRRAAGEHEVVLSASTANDTLQIGTAPDYGFLIIAIPIETMSKMTAANYIGDITGRDDLNTRVIAKIFLTITDGLTIQPVVVPT